MNTEYLRKKQEVATIWFKEGVEKERTSTTKNSLWKELASMGERHTKPWKRREGNSIALQVVNVLWEQWVWRREQQKLGQGRASDLQADLWCYNRGLLISNSPEPNVKHSPCHGHFLASTYCSASLGQAEEKSVSVILVRLSAWIDTSTQQEKDTCDSHSGGCGCDFAAKRNLKKKNLGLG